MTDPARSVYLDTAHINGTMGEANRPLGGVVAPSVQGASPIRIGDRLMTNAIPKTCTKCTRSLPESSFAKSPVGAGGLRAECRECRAVGDREYLLRRRFGISVDDYDALLVTQGGACALCDSPTPGGRWTRFHVDHCHTTGRVRGLLCYRCNVALGALGDSPESILRAYNYVAGTGDAA